MTYRTHIVTLPSLRESKTLSLDNIESHFNDELRKWEGWDYVGTIRLSDVMYMMVFRRQK